LSARVAALEDSDINASSSVDYFLSFLFVYGFRHKALMPEAYGIPNTCFDQINGVTKQFFTFSERNAHLIMSIKKNLCRDFF